MQTVYIVRDVEERYLQGVYGSWAKAQDAITAKVEEAIASVVSAGNAEDYDLDPQSDEWEWVRDDYEILEMTVE